MKTFSFFIDMHTKTPSKKRKKSNMDAEQKFYTQLENSCYSLIQKSATLLPEDVQEAMKKAKYSEKKDSNAEFSLQTIEENVKMAEQKSVPMCQDTGFLSFFITTPEKNTLPFFSQKKIKDHIHNAVIKATKDGILRPNSVDSITGQNPGNNMGIHIPKISFQESGEDNESETNSSNNNTFRIQLLLKGGGSENVSAQHALPFQSDFGRAGRDLEGVQKAVLQTVKNAEGKGCAPGILSVHIGGDRATGYEQSKKNFFRTLNSKNPDKALAQLETEILHASNNLGIGPMGFGGNTTVLDVFISASHRIPACFFVTISYSCWALRRGSIICNKTGEIQTDSWKEEIREEITLDSSKKNTEEREEGEISEDNSKKLRFPLSKQDIENLHTGDKVLLSGKIFTGRDTIHHYVVEEKKSLPVDISGSAIYHCGPVMKKIQKISETHTKDSWEVIAAGPTTSIREEPYQSEFLQKTGVRGIIGKGGMGEKTLQGLQDHKAVYFHAIGGAAAVYAEKITAVTGGHFIEEFGIPEALWELEIKDFPVIVTMDSHGESFYEK